MPKRDRRPPGSAESPGIPHDYEGPEALTALLRAAGSPLEAEEVAARFHTAQADGIARSEAIPDLFPQEPRFASPDDARRLYANLFGLWDRVAAGLGSEAEEEESAPTPIPTPRPAPVLPPRGMAKGEQLEPKLVEAVWRWLAAAPDREERRVRDRYENGQPNVVAFVDALEVSESGGLAAADLAFETWAMFDQAFGDRLGAVEWSDVEALQAEPPPLEAEQPALAAYVAEQLNNLADEDTAFDEEERAQVERALATVAAALTGAIEGHETEPKPS